MLFHNTEILYLFQQFYFSVPQNSIDIFFRNQVILLPVLLLYAKTERILIMKFSQDLQETMKYLNNELHTDRNFDVVYRVLTIGGKNACLYFIDGFTKDDTLLKLLQALSSIQADRMPKDAHSFSKQYLPYGEIGLIHESSEMVLQLLSGVSCLFIDGYDACLTIDCRTYPARGVSEPEKDKVMRGSRDGFVETLVFNTALIRRRIRDPKLSIEIMTAGESSHTDIAICYMDEIGFFVVIKVCEKVKHLVILLYSSIFNIDDFCAIYIALHDGVQCILSFCFRIESRKHCFN